MSESAPRISDEAVEFWAAKIWEREYRQRLAGNFFGRFVKPAPFAELTDHARAPYLIAASEDLTAILPLLCGGLEEELDSARLVLGEWREKAGNLAEARLKAEQELEQVREERDLAIAHDRRPYPTADAYEKACAALTRKTDQLNQVREEVERRRKQAANFAEISADPYPALARTESEVADRLQAILDSSSSLSGDGGSSGLDAFTRIELWELRAFALQAGVEDLPEHSSARSALDKLNTLLDGNSGDVEERGEEGCGGSGEVFPHPPDERDGYTQAEQCPGCRSCTLPPVSADVLLSDGAISAILSEISGLSPESVEDRQDLRRALRAIFFTQQSSTTSNSLSGEPGDRADLKRFAAELRETAQKWQRERAKTKQAEKDDRASGKLKPEDSYEATWNYYEGLAKAYELAARDAEELLHTQPNPDPHLSGDGERLKKIASDLEFRAEALEKYRRSEPAKRARADADYLRGFISRLSDRRAGRKSPLSEMVERGEKLDNPDSRFTKPQDEEER